MYILRVCNKKKKNYSGVFVCFYFIYTCKIKIAFPSMVLHKQHCKRKHFIVHVPIFRFSLFVYIKLSRNHRYKICVHFIIHVPIFRFSLFVYIKLSRNHSYKICVRLTFKM